jgi:probable rRNA maturation factor
MVDSDSRSRKGRGARRKGRGATGEGRRGTRLHVEVISPGGPRPTSLARWLQRIAPAQARGEITIAIVPDARVRALNRQYRRMDKPTDVLSFPSDERGYLGDVVIAAGVARRQAAAAGHALHTELRILALHGLLHLLGYDHERDDGRMSRVEHRLRVEGGLREGLIERGALRLRSGPAR